MKNFLILICALLTFASCSKKYEEVKGDMSQTRIYTLKNGLKVYLSVNKEEPRIQTFIAVRTGSKNDPAETTGLAHYLEHLMFKGTAKFGVTDPEAEAPLLDDIEARYEKYRKLTDPEARRQAYHEIDSVSQLAAQYFIPNEYDKLMSAIGAEGTNAYTSEDVTCYTEDIPSNEIENWAKIQSDRFQNMVIRGFHTELEAVYEEYNIHLTSDIDKLFTAMSAKLYPNHPYGTQTTIGTQEHLKNPSITNIKEYFKKWYVPNNVAICMAGDFDPDETIAIIEKYFGEWQPSTDADGKVAPVEQPSFPELAPITAPIDTTVIGLEAETIWLGWRFDEAKSLQSDTLQVIESMLSNGTAGLIDLDINQQMKMLEAWGGAMASMDYSMFLLAGTPREGQTLDEVRALLLAEIEKLKKGEFSDDLLPSVINNLKLQYYNALENNRSRANMFVQSFVNGTPWEQEVKLLDRLEGMTKEQIVAFANRHFQNNYVAVYKRQGVDPTQKKIDKPQITPIPTNRDLVSDFVTEIQNSEVKPIEPKFVDFQKDLTFGNLNPLPEIQIPYIYVQNNENGRFQLSFHYDFGEESDVRYNYAAEYIDYLGTDSLTAEQLKQQFYKLACNYHISVGSRSIDVVLNGLGENMPQAVALLEHLLQNAKVDEDAYRQYIAIREKGRVDAKSDQRTNFQYLVQYGLYGPYNSYRNSYTAQQLAQENPQELLDLLKNLSQYEHTVLYYGPMNQLDLTAALDSHMATLKSTLKPVPEGKHYTMQATPENEILIAPFDAKNIYMRMYHNEQLPWNADEAPVKALFNEYYGGGMNTIVFQELREARGLAYNAYAAYVEPSYKGDPEYYFTHIITQNDKMMDCVRQFHVILDSIPESENAFKIAKDALTKRLASQRTTKFGLINAWLYAKLRGIDYDINERIYNALPSITLNDVVRFEQERMARKPYRYIILGDEKELDMAALQQYGPVKRVTTQEVFGY
ncbi:insulinase family protein [Prevotella sp. E9-3]|uniref:M16 family metallopeptidase n=1 Tax=Prevotella sp. E9-3 TaxID=2913621 RepID=UPI001EDA72DE|nr:M16 family metallopeptidase [Prevotella sp. E9-3]UKK47883.1 insulinase family protein [Prevotella sp. E9-3]